MSLTQQYALDVYRLNRNGQAPPPVPGTLEGRELATALRRLRVTWRDRARGGPGSFRTGGSGAGS